MKKISKKFEYLPLTAYSTSLTSGFNVSIVKEACRFCPFSIILLRLVTSRTVLNDNRFFNVSIISILEQLEKKEKKSPIPINLFELYEGS